MHVALESYTCPFPAHLCLCEEGPLSAVLLMPLSSSFEVWGAEGGSWPFGAFRDEFC